MQLAERYTALILADRSESAAPNDSFTNEGAGLIAACYPVESQQRCQSRVVLLQLKRSASKLSPQQVHKVQDKRRFSMS